MKGINMYKSKLTVGWMTFVVILSTSSINPMFSQQKHKVTQVIVKGIEAIDAGITKGVKAVRNFLNSKQTPIDYAMNDLDTLVYYSTQRCIWLSNWNIDTVGKDAEEKFDSTINGIEKYLDFVKDDGIVYQASMKIKVTATELARDFREKSVSNESDTVISNNYSRKVLRMEKAANDVDAIWKSITSERQPTYDVLQRLKKRKQLYVDTKKTESVEEAVRQLGAVAEDLRNIRISMQKVIDTLEKE
jgi:hypothetical protein